MLTELSLTEAFGLQTEENQGLQKRQHAPVPEAQWGGSLSIANDGGLQLLETLLPEGTVVSDLLQLEQATIGREADRLQLRQILQAASDIEVARVVDGGLGAQRAAFLVVLLDTGLLVIDVQRRDDAGGNHARAKASRGAPGEAALKDQLHLIGATQVEVLANDLLEEHPASIFSAPSESASRCKRPGSSQERTPLSSASKATPRCCN